MTQLVAQRDSQLTPVSQQQLYAASIFWFSFFFFGLCVVCAGWASAWADPLCSAIVSCVAAAAAADHLLINAAPCAVINLTPSFGPRSLSIANTF